MSGGCDAGELDCLEVPAPANLLQEDCQRRSTQPGYMEWMLEVAIWLQRSLKSSIPNRTRWDERHETRDEPPQARVNGK